MVDIMFDIMFDMGCIFFHSSISYTPFFLSTLTIEPDSALFVSRRHGILYMAYGIQYTIYGSLFCIGPAALVASAVHFYSLRLRLGF